MAEVSKLWLRPMSRAPSKNVTSAVAVENQGLEGDHAVGGKRQVTLIDRESWSEACDELGVAVDPVERRANVLVEGLRLGPTIGQRLRVGEVLLEILGETAPCELMDDAQLGLHAALRPDRRAGVFGRILEGGTIRVGDEVSVAS